MTSARPSETLVLDERVSEIDPVIRDVIRRAAKQVAAELAMDYREGKFPHGYGLYERFLDEDFD